MVSSDDTCCHVTVLRIEVVLYVLLNIDGLLCTSMGLPVFPNQPCTPYVMLAVQSAEIAVVFLSILLHNV